MFQETTGVTDKDMHREAPEEAVKDMTKGRKLGGLPQRLLNRCLR